MEEVKHLMQLVEEFPKLPPSHPNYLENHKTYLRLEHALDEAVMEFFTKEKKGKLENGKYFN